ncbi:MAG: hypothetical protein EP332_03285 [Bacteroidetes bacterium]|nr:MAG: hypothetical protein EP332_03285 [Bacteroidota bacterium]
MKYWWISIVLLCRPISGLAQEAEGDFWQEEVPSLEEEDILRRQSHYRININTASLEEWMSLPGASIDFIQAVLVYRKHHQFQSIYELQIIEGADLEWLKQVKRRLVCNNDQLDISATRREMLVRFKPDLYGRKGFSDTGESAFLGKAIQQYWRYHDARKQWDWGLSVEQDAGESWQRGPDHVGMFVRYRPGQTLKSVVLGDYQLSLGQGLLTRNTRQIISGAIGDGLVSWNGILPLASANEYLFNRGIALEYQLESWQFITAFSRRKLDGRFKEEGGYTLYQSGLHRNRSELAYRKSISEQKLMQRIAWSLGTYQMGLNLVWNSLSKATEASGVSFDYKYQGNKIYTYGEFLLRSKKEWEALHGVLYSMRIVDLHWRWFGTSHQRQSTLTLNFPLKRKQILSLRWQKEKQYAPSYRLQIPGELSSFWLTGPIPNWIKLKGSWRLAYETQYRDQSGNQETIKVIQYHRWLRARLHFHLLDNEEWRLDYRFEWVKHEVQSIAKTGQLNYLQLSYALKDWSLFLRYTLFQTADYDTRLYAYEQDLPYVFSVPLFYGKGQRLALMAKKKFKRYTCVGKWTLTAFPEIKESGSGADSYAGKVLHQFSLQFSCSW